MEPPLAWGQKPAGFWIRAGALMLDYLATGIVGLPLLLIAAVLGEKKMEGASLAVFVLYGLVYFAYFTLFTAFSGQTLGKMAMGIKVLGPDGEKPGMLRAAARFLSTGVSHVLLGIGYIMAGFTGQKRALHDFICGTRVVRMRSLPVVGLILVSAIPLISVPVMGILAAVAIPKFAETLEKSRIGATKGNLSSLRTAIALHYGDTGKYPSSIDAPDFVGKYMSEVPAIKLKDTPLPANKVESYRFTDGDGRVDPQRLKLTGHWAYDSRAGIVIVDSDYQQGKNGEPAYSW